MLVQLILKDKSMQGVKTVKPGSTVADAVKLLSENKIGTVIVSETGDSPDGILSERDIVWAIGKSGTSCLDQPVDDLMTANPVCCSTGDRAIQVLQMMTDGRFRHMPVMDGDKMVGLVSIGDVVKARLQELAQQADSLKNMIMGY